MTIPTPVPSLSIPAYRLHKPSGQAVVTLNSRDHYLGLHATHQSRAEYERLIGEWLVKGRAPLQDVDGGPSVNEIMLAYLQFADGYYRDAAGQPTREVETMTLVFRPLKELYGHTCADQFGPKALVTVRNRMIENGLCRRTVNQRIGYIKRLFAWSSAQGIIPAPTYHGLLCVKSLPPGRSGVRDTEPVKPVPEAYVNAITPFLPPTLQAMLGLQRLTGMRSGELVRMRACQIDMTGSIWLYRPEKHKSQYLQRTRVIPLGKRCQDLIRPFLTLQPQEPLFSPRQSEAERDRIAREKRKTPVQPSQLCRKTHHAKRTPGLSFDTRSYYAALRYAMKAAQKTGLLLPEHFWHPHQLRHNAAQRIAQEIGAEAARAYLGHAKIDMTAHYAGLDQTLALSVAQQVG